MRSPTVQRIIDEMEKDSWWVKLKRWLRIEWWTFKCLTRKYWDKAFINRRDHIAHWRIRRGTILRVFPTSRSHRKKPYKVVVLYSDKSGFITRLYKEKHEHDTLFEYESLSWTTYHHNRFQIVKY